VVVSKQGCTASANCDDINDILISHILPPFPELEDIMKHEYEFVVVHFLILVRSS
jgi:hypothetical protein